MVEESRRHAFPLRRFLWLAVLAIAAGTGLAIGHRYTSLSALAANREWLLRTVERSGGFGPLLFVGAYAGLTALSVPGAVILTIAGGLLFGAWLGTLYTVIGATIGATAVFLMARAGLTGLAERAGPRVRRLEAGFRENAFNYLLVLRLVPLFPFWLVNLVAGLAGMRLRSYVLATLIGILPGTFVYASLGHGLDTVAAQGTPDLGTIFRPSALVPIIGLALLALVPVAYRRWHPAQGTM